MHHRETGGALDVLVSFAKINLTTSYQAEKSVGILLKNALRNALFAV